MKVIPLIYLIFYQIAFLQSQNIDTLPFTLLTQTEVNIYHCKIENRSGGTSPFSNEFKGELKRGVAQLHGIPITRLKANTDTLAYYIGYKVFSGFNISELENFVLKILMKHCQFHLTDIEDTCQVWQIVVRDSSKLNPFSWKKDRPDGTTWHYPINGGKDIEMFGQTFTAIAKWLEIDSDKYIFETDSDDTMDEPKRYKFTIPCEYIINIDLLKKFMLEKYGIDFVPKTSIIHKKYIEFYKTN